MNNEILEALKNFVSEVSSFANNVAYYAENEEQRGHARDVESAADYLVELLESGLTMRTVDVCPVCNGTRQDPAYSHIPVNCPACQGTGIRN